MKIRDIDRFEKLNADINISVFGLDNVKVFPMQITSKSNAPHRVNLLYISKDEISHYVLKDLSRLITKQLSGGNGRKFICQLCLHACTSQEILHKHLHLCFS